MTRFNAQKLVIGNMPRDFMVYPKAKPLINLLARTGWTGANQIYTMLIPSILRINWFKAWKGETAFAVISELSRKCDSHRYYRNDVSSILHAWDA